MSTWTATIENKTKAVLSFCDTITGVTFTRTLNEPASVQCEFAISGLDAQALFAQLGTGSVYLRLAENGTSRFFGVLNDLQSDMGDSATVSATFNDLAQQYAGSYYQFSVGGNRYVSQAAEGSLASSIDTILNTTDVLLPLTRSGSPTASRFIDPQVTSRLDLLQSLGQISNGIDWFVVADQTFKCADQLGSNVASNVRFVYSKTGESNTASATMQYLPPRNEVFTDREDGTVSRTSTMVDATSKTNYGAYQVVVSKLDRRSASETDVAEQVIRPSWRQVIDVHLEPSQCPRPFSDFDLGDTVEVYLVTDAFTVDALPRVSQIVYSFDEQLVETDIAVSMEVKP